MKSVKQMYKEVGKLLWPGTKYSVELDYKSWYDGKAQYVIYIALRSTVPDYIHVQGDTFEEALNKAKEKLNEFRYPEGSSRAPEDVCGAPADKD